MTTTPAKPATGTLTPAEIEALEARKEQRPDTITVAEFMIFGYAAKVAHNQCEVMDGVYHVNDVRHIPSKYNPDQYSVVYTEDVSASIVPGRKPLTVRWLPAAAPQPEILTTLAAMPRSVEEKRIAALEAEVVALKGDNAQMRNLLIRTFPLIKDMAIAMKYDDVLGTSVSMGGELPTSETAEIAALKAELAEAHEMLRSIEDCDYEPHHNDAFVLFTELQMWQEKIADLLGIENEE